MEFSSNISLKCTGKQKLDTLIVFFEIHSIRIIEIHLFLCTVWALNILASMRNVPR